MGVIKGATRSLDYRSYVDSFDYPSLVHFGFCDPLFSKSIA